MGNNPVKTASEFYHKYGLVYSSGHIDEAQLKDSDKLREDYYNLNSKERYAVFTRLVKGNEEEALKRLFTKTGLRFATCLGESEYFYASKAIFDKLISDFKNGKYKDKRDLWSGRLAIAEGLFFCSKKLEAYTKWKIAGQSSDNIEEIKAYCFSQSSKLYLASGEKYWDTDRDGYFDNEDTAPLDPKYYLDRDRDLVPDRIDPNDKNSKVWNRIPKNGEVKGYDYDVARLGGDNYEIRVNIYLKADENVKDQIESAITADKRRLLEKTIEKFYDDHVEEKAKNIKLRIKFVDSENAAHHVVTVCDKEIRPNSSEWNLPTLEEPDTMTHEILHLLGLHDYYHEALVAENIRDHTFAPGFVLIDPRNIMNGPPDNPIIRAYQMRGIVAKIDQESDNEPSAEEQTAADKIDDLWSDFTSGKRVGEQPSSEGTKNIRNLINSLLEKSKTAPEDASPILAIARAYWLIGEREKAIEYYGKLYEKTEDVDTYRKAIDDLWFCIDKKEIAMTFSKEILKKMPEDFDSLETASYLSRELGEYQKAYEYALKMIKLKSDSPTGYQYTVEPLYEMGKKEEAFAATIETLKKTNKKDDPLLQELLTEYFIEKNEIQFAERVLCFYGTPSNYEYSDFAKELAEKQLWEKAKQYYEKAYPNVKNICNQGCFSDYVKILYTLKEYTKIHQLYQTALVQDPYNIDIHKRLTKLYVQTKEYDRAARQLIEIARITNRIKNRHNLDASLKKEIKSAVNRLSLKENIETKNILTEELKKICNKQGPSDADIQIYCDLLISAINQ